MFVPLVVGADEDRRRTRCPAWPSRSSGWSLGTRARRAQDRGDTHHDLHRLFSLRRARQIPPFTTGRPSPVGGERPGVDLVELARDRLRGTTAPCARPRRGAAHARGRDGSVRPRDPSQTRAGRRDDDAFQQKETRLPTSSATAARCTRSWRRATSVRSPWLGHATVQTTESYVRADPTAKLEAIDAVLPPALRRGRFQAPDKLLRLTQALAEDDVSVTDRARFPSPRPLHRLLRRALRSSRD